MTRLNKMTANNETHITAPKGTPLYDMVVVGGVVGIEYRENGKVLSKDTSITYTYPWVHIKTSEGYVKPQDVLDGIISKEREWKKPNKYLPIALIIIAAVTIIAIITYKRKHK